MSIPLLMLLLSWSPVTVDCLGMPESINHYEVHYMYRTCRDWDGDWFSAAPPSCDVLAFTRDIDETEFRSLGDDPPQIGSGWWYEIIAVDGAGNRSDECQSGS